MSEERNPTPAVVDLRSDTVTRPSPGMREAMATAVVGDHVLGDDPTASELEERAAELLGKERALFFPSGTMANQIAINLLSKRGSRVLAMEGAHVLDYEEMAAAAWSGVHITEVDWSGFSTDGWQEKIASDSPFRPRVSLLCYENTHNSAGGVVTPPDAFAPVCEVAREAGIPVHLDGARLPNAAVAAGVDPSAWTRNTDTVMMSLSKGLGAPVGSILAGDAPTMDEAWRTRRRFGGGMRQAGVLAAAAIFALDHNWERLADDHRRARRLAEGVSAIDGLAASRPDSNIVMIEVEHPSITAEGLLDRLAQTRILMVQFGTSRLRAVTHLDVDDAGIDLAVRTLASAVEAEIR